VDFDPVSLLLGNDPEAMARARAAALRGQALTGAVLGLAHEPGAEKVGAQFVQQAEQGNEQMGTLAGNLLQQKLQMMVHGPQAALGGQTPETYGAITHRLSVPRFTSGGQFPVVIDTRTGETKPIADANGQPLVPTHVAQEREKRKASLYIGPDLEPTDDLVSRVANGQADPNSPGMKQSLEKASKLNTAAAGFTDVAQRLHDFLGKHPNGKLAGTDATEAEAIAQDLRSLYMENLNMQTLRASDIPILNNVIADPTQLGNVIKSGVGALDLKKQLETAVALAKQRALSQAGALGYQPSRGGRYTGFQQVRDAGAGGAAPTASGSVDVISPEGVAGKIPAANLDAALKRGFRRAGP
jgi:hypothetical protein